VPIVLAAAYGAARPEAGGLAALALHHVPLAAIAACLSVGLAIPAALTPPLLPWLLPLWFAQIIGTAGWVLLPLPPGAAGLVGSAIAMLLPVAVCLISGAWAEMPAGSMEAGAASGLSPQETLLKVLLRPGLAALPRIFLVLFILAVGVIAPSAGP
jgi:ABC-type arginine/histidine transport system permease subunit